ncbi:putative hydroxymethylglutaryl-CoA lyase [Caenibius tardaugens NBRC 16725]|uniref:Putative hydroxymethylglutaryl-CoA lyase n=1 Tax=Caenibius tardaugens NBRC 16725 TaxID=1219035 RepID=U2ZZ53_9SPHN|nr:hydroxymethylglutaryl-CoA lyase [Caenibius tardaugens]AZI36988.1 hydroxymethylglutaryl-CoA lyase [Caenibius tardaugens NBRC 16725]GAD47793.1 putative hydroxymethylglutaryl-CoA lyase [Caenibius tardaugens NBRC 16725]
MTSVEIVEVGPRDGLQNEKLIVATADKVELAQRAIAAGVKRLEVTSFVNPKRVPQMADAEDVVKLLGRPEGVTRIGLVLNEQGAQRAIDCGMDQLGAVALATDAFGIRNQKQTSAESVEVARRIIAMGKAAGRSAQVTISVAFGCPFAGEVDPARVVAMARQLADAGPCEIALADTIGVAVPGQVSRLIAAVRAEIGAIPVRAHFHDTRNTAIANVWAAVEAGAATIDAALGGLGGCPFAPGAAGNVATEDVIYLLDRSGVTTGIDFASLVTSSKWLGGVMGKELPSMLARAGGFPEGEDA